MVWRRGCQAVFCSLLQSCTVEVNRQAKTTLKAWMSLGILVWMTLTRSHKSQCKAEEVILGWQSAPHPGVCGCSLASYMSCCSDSSGDHSFSTGVGVGSGWPSGSTWSLGHVTTSAPLISLCFVLCPNRYVTFLMGDVCERCHTTGRRNNFWWANKAIGHTVL